MEVISSRLKMTQVLESDWELFRSLHTDSAVISLCFDEPEPAELREQFESRLPSWGPDSRHWLCLAVSIRETAEKIGVTGFCMRDGVAEVGYLFLPEFHGFGFGTESLKALISWAKETHNIQKFNAVVTEGNVASERVLEKCGFSLQCVEPDSYKIGGKLYSDKIYAIENVRA